MRSTTGEHFIALDHVRALACFMVFVWHFARLGAVPSEGSPAIFPLALLDEGHTGVALFMTLSGYLFAKLLDGKRISYPAFVYNRALRLLPLLALVIAIDCLISVGRDGVPLARYALDIAKGVIKPTLPNGGWSITVEFHFYLILPVLLWMFAKSKQLPWLLLASAVLLRAWLWARQGGVQDYSYWTIIGRIDQFLIGMIACHSRGEMRGRHGLAAVTLLAFSAFYALFDAQGGFYGGVMQRSVLWVMLPTIEGTAYASLIAWYDSSFKPKSTGASAFIGKIGEYSYSIYLIHLFFVGYLATFIHRHIMDTSNFYVATLWAIPAFLATAAIASLSYRYVESPFLRLRKRYTQAPADAANGIRTLGTEHSAG